jgi:hypothetical protein
MVEWKEVSGNMHVKDLDGSYVDYVVFKFLGKSYSTDRDKKQFIKWQFADTRNVGLQINTWIKGIFVEEDNHNKLSISIPFELNIYSKITKEIQTKFPDIIQDGK